VKQYTSRNLSEKNPQTSPREVYKKLLTIAGSDSGGGAGIQADLKTFFALGGYGLSVITALTAQNTQEVTAIYPVTAQFVGEQLDAVFSDIGADAVKIGMLHDVEIIKVVKQKLALYSPKYIVVDPVMVAQSGARLITEAGVLALQNELFSCAYLITPNVPEAEILLGTTITDVAQMEEAALLLAQKYQLNVLLKGGHFTAEESCDVLYDIDRKDWEWFCVPRIDTRNTHGTGCTFSSAITTFLAFDDDLKTAIQKAKRYLTTAILLGKDYQLGHGNGPVNHWGDTFSQNTYDKK